jgi:hypothetical protein
MPKNKMNGEREMKIIGVDNYARENVDDILVAENVSEYYAKLIVKKLNIGGDESRFYKAVNDDYVLYEYDPNE